MNKLRDASTDTGNVLNLSQVVTSRISLLEVAVRRLELKVQELEYRERAKNSISIELGGTGSSKPATVDQRIFLDRLKREQTGLKYC